MENGHFETAAAVTGEKIKSLLCSLDEKTRSEIWEIRLRCNKPLVVTCAGVPHFLYSPARLSPILSSGAVSVGKKELNDIFLRLCSFSVHSHTQSLTEGYITIDGGHRAGVFGTAVHENGRIVAVRDISCINIRIAHEIIGAADEIYCRVFGDSLPSVLIAGAPSSGKTTLLRDLSRQLSGKSRGRFLRTVICDERNEIAAVRNSVALSDIGENCDVLTGYPKAQGILLALRSLSPQIIICDEVGAEEEISAMENGFNSGVSFVVSIHASTRNELVAKPQLRRLLTSGIFKKVVLLSGGNQPCKIKEIYETEDLSSEICGADYDSRGVCACRQICGGHGAHGC